MNQRLLVTLKDQGVNDRLDPPLTPTKTNGIVVRNEAIFIYRYASMEMYPSQSDNASLRNLTFHVLTVQEYRER